MAEETKQIPRYKLGDTIRIQLDVSDESGVEEVTALFRTSSGSTNKYIRMSAKGDRKTDTTVTLEKEVGPDMSPGEYTCDWVELRDTRDNRTLLTGLEEMRFRVEDFPGDHKGPELKDWQIISPESILSEEAFGESTTEPLPEEP